MKLHRVMRIVAMNLGPFGLRDTESLMNLSRLGTLRCHCVPTDANEESNDRRSSCRACGNAIVATDPARLYQQITPGEIRQITQRLRRAAISAQEFAFAGAPATLHFSDDAR